jgi:hypothetical protein
MTQFTTRLFLIYNHDYTNIKHEPIYYTNLKYDPIYYTNIFRRTNT